MPFFPAANDISDIPERMVNKCLRSCLNILVLSIIVDTISQKIYKPANIYYSTYSLR